ncbi:hypothetical protein EDB80DRAFT_390289 [Ilyonectria destructans]|nr:hypothetical protein EDB80DRAFT_390289 [Ilyonectria destructans]
MSAKRLEREVLRPEVEASGLPAHALGMTAARIEAPAVGGPGCDLVLCHGRVSFKEKYHESPTCYHRHPAAGGDAGGRGAGGLRHNLSRSAMAATAQQGLNGGTSRLPEANTVAEAVAPPKPSQACPDGRKHSRHQNPRCSSLVNLGSRLHQLCGRWILCRASSPLLRLSLSRPWLVLAQVHPHPSGEPSGGSLISLQHS